MAFIQPIAYYCCAKNINAIETPATLKGLGFGKGYA